ncbi:hypothetical protein AB0M43_23895 [Longispora sp. NPDC051575]|uniref:hypothetical protein n=1 Tax=Longispora sp. NPDC051575 TaxID=3154943 RepID=UPI00343F0E88
MARTRAEDLELKRQAAAAVAAFSGTVADRVTRVLVAGEDRTRARAALADADRRYGDELAGLVALGLSADMVAELCAVPAGDVPRSPVARPGRRAARPGDSGPGPGGDGRMPGGQG